MFAFVSRPQMGKTVLKGVVGILLTFTLFYGPFKKSCLQQSYKIDNALLILQMIKYSKGQEICQKLVSWEELNQNPTQVSLPAESLAFPLSLSLLPFVPMLALFHHCLSKGLAFNKWVGGMPDQNNTKCIEQGCLEEDSSICQSDQ